jgi:hypothetical protein
MGQDKGYHMPWQDWLVTSTAPSQTICTPVYIKIFQTLVLLVNGYAVVDGSPVGIDLESYYLVAVLVVVYAVVVALLQFHPHVVA